MTARINWVLVSATGYLQELRDLMYYDDKGRNTATYSQHLFNATLSKANYDFITTTYNNITNEVTATNRQHYTTAGSSPAVTIANTYAYDHMGRKRQTTEQINGGQQVTISQLDYNDAGQLYKKHLGNEQQVVTYAYNERGWLTGSSSSMFSLGLNYNTPQYGATAQYNGNIAEQTYNAAISGPQHVTYAYDNLNRLTAGNSTTGFSETGITYDVMGNIQGLTRAGYGNLSYSYNANQLTAVSGYKSRNYAYDANGNSTTDGEGHTFVYNLLNLPAQVLGLNLNYLYKADGTKIRKTTGSTAIDYISGIQYLNGNIDFIQTEEGRAINSGGTYKYEYTLTDHLGNNRVTFDQTNGKVGEDDYYPFGFNVHRQQNNGNKYLYNGKELQEELTQYDYGARFYDPVIARFNTVDPHASSYLSWSSYSYVANNPITSIDPDGRDLIVLSAPNHVGGLGHAAVLIGNEHTGYRYYSKNGTTDHHRAYGRSNDNPQTGTKTFASLKEFVMSKENKKEGPYEKAYEIKTDEATDKKMEAAAKASVESDYNVLCKSCIDVASDAAKAGGLNPGTTPHFWGVPHNNFLTPIPRFRFNNMILNNPGGTVIYLPIPQPQKGKVGTVSVNPVDVIHTTIPDKKPN